MMNVLMKILMLKMWFASMTFTLQPKIRETFSVVDSHVCCQSAPSHTEQVG